MDMKYVASVALLAFLSTGLSQRRDAVREP
jgi:hypothetical protein